MFKIDKGIPVQPQRRRGKPDYPFADMEVGDSFFTPRAKITPVCAAASYFAVQHEQRIKFTCRTVDNGVRVWRIK